MTRKRRKPHDPAAWQTQRLEARAKQEAKAKADRRNPGNWGAEVDQTLPAHADTEVRRDARGRATGAWRSSVINALQRSGALNEGHVHAAEKLAQEWAAWKGLEGRPDRVGVDGASGAPDLVTARMITFGDIVNVKLTLVGPQARRLLKAFMVAMVEEDRPMSWRGIVERETRETREKEQRAMAVFAFEELRLVSEGRGERRLHPFGEAPAEEGADQVRGVAA